MGLNLDRYNESIVYLASERKVICIHVAMSRGMSFLSLKRDGVQQLHFKAINL